MERVFSSLLWDREEYYEEWLQDKKACDKEYIYDLNLEYLYEEIRRIGGFGDHFDFRDIFLYSCQKSSTVKYRQRIMKRIFENSRLYDCIVELVSCISDVQKKMERVCSTRDKWKKKIFFLQILYEFLCHMGKIHTELKGQIEIPAKDIVGREAEEKKRRLHDYLSMLDQNTPGMIVLNKDENQICRSAVIWPEKEEEEKEVGYFKRLKSAASYFLEDYDDSIRVYQDMDITCLDKRIQEYFFRNQPNLQRNTEELYEACREFDFWPFIRLANELVFYLSCIRFRKRYENEKFYFSVPECRDEADTRVIGAYDMVLGVNLFREGKGFLAVPNDIRFDQEGRFFLLTGANQGGKTTYIRSIGLVQHLAQIGMFVPARKAVLGMVRHIHTHFSRDDQEGALVGRFEQELERMQKLLKNLDEGDMVLLNETFTSTQRMGAVALLRRLLLEFDRRRCIGGLVTHYHEIMDELGEGSFYSLAAGVEKDGNHMDRTFQIVRMESYHQSFARDIAVKCGVTYEQLLQVLDAAEEKRNEDVLF